MSEIIERVAKAICARRGSDPDAPFVDRHGRKMDFPEWTRWEAEARAAIEAMREPTSEMSRSGAKFDDLMPSDAAHIYHKMIDEALK